MENFESLFENQPIENKLFILSFLIESFSPFNLKTLTALINFSRTSKLNHQIANDNQLWKPILQKILPAYGYNFTNETFYLAGFEENIKELAVLLIQHNFRIHFTNFPDDATARNNAIGTSLIKLLQLSKEKASNLLIQLTLAELKFVHEDWAGSLEICIQFQQQYEEFAMLSFLMEAKKDNNFYSQNTSLIKRAGDEFLIKNPVLIPYANFSQQVLDALVVNRIAADRVLSLLLAKAETENKIDKLYLINSNALLTLMQCKNPASIIKTLDIETIAKSAGEFYEFSAIPRLSFLYLFSNAKIEDASKLTTMLNSTTQFLNPLARLKKNILLKLMQHFTATELIDLSTYPRSMQKELHFLDLCQNEQILDLLIPKLLEFKKFYLEKIKNKSFEVVNAVYLYNQNKLQILQTDAFIPLMNIVSLENIRNISERLLIKLSSLNTQQLSALLNGIYRDLIQIDKAKNFEEVWTICSYANGKLIANKYITPIQIDKTLSKDRRKLLIKLLPTVVNWSAEQFRYFMHLRSTTENLFSAAFIKSLNTIADFIPPLYSFERMKALTQYAALLPPLIRHLPPAHGRLLLELANNLDYLKKLIVLPIDQLAQLKLKQQIVASQRSLAMRAVYKSIVPPRNYSSYWQKPMEVDQNNKRALERTTDDSIEQTDSNSNLQQTKRHKINDSQEELEESQNVSENNVPQKSMK